MKEGKSQSRELTKEIRTDKQTFRDSCNQRDKGGRVTQTCMEIIDRQTVI